jgi:hypothetical protein
MQGEAVHQDEGLHTLKVSCHRLHRLPASSFMVWLRVLRYLFLIILKRGHSVRECSRASSMVGIFLKTTMKDLLSGQIRADMVNSVPVGEE